MFGPEFPKGLDQLPLGKWSGPIASIHGWHLVFIEDIRPARPFHLNEVKNQIKAAIRKEREEQRLTDMLEKLRSQYNIVIALEGNSHE